ncbi:MAG: cytidylate kinase-like family protein [Bacteroidales bacterium]|nr:cytidylate kinase-like family protein [Bacteroidales bacterium]
MDTNEKFIITISRELGSGGRTIGRKLAERLGVRYSDKALIHGLVEKFDLTTYEIEKIKAAKKNWLADFIERVAPVPTAGAMLGPHSEIRENLIPHYATSEEVFAAEAEILRGIAAEESCVIAGRSGFFVLKDCPNKLDIFIRASMENRIRRVMRKQNFSESEARTVIQSVDESRDNYIKRYTGTSRYDARNYDLTLNVDNLSEDEAVEVILKYIKSDK